MVMEKENIQHLFLYLYVNMCDFNTQKLIGLNIPNKHKLRSVTRRVPLLEQELLTFPEHLKCVLVHGAQSLVFM